MKKSRVGDFLTAPILPSAPQGFFELAQPRLIISPSSKPRSINRLPDLLRAGCMHGALVLMEAKAALLERQVQVIEKPPDFFFEIIHEIIVYHMMHEPRRGYVEVSHCP